MNSKDVVSIAKREVHGKYGDIENEQVAYSRLFRPWGPWALGSGFTLIGLIRPS